MPLPTHLLIPCAAGAALDTDALLATLPALPHLQQLLARLAPERTIETLIDSPDMPCELALAAELGLCDVPGRTPWAAFETHTIGTPCAFVKLCHWQVGMDQVQALDPAALGLTDAESQALLTAAAPWFAEDGIALSHHQPGVWLAKGEVFRELITISLDRAIGRTVSRELLQSTGAHAGPLSRLQHEMQMLFYNHPVTDARLRHRQLAPNAIWITGAGVLPSAVPARTDLQIETRLSDAAGRSDAQAFVDGWRAVDADSIAQLAAQQDVRLTLCGERRAITFAAPTNGWAARLARRFLQTSPSTASILSQL